MIFYRPSVALSLHSTPRILRQPKRPRILSYLLTEALLSAWGQSASQCRSSNMTRISTTNVEQSSPQESKIPQTQFFLMIRLWQTRSSRWLNHTGSAFSRGSSRPEYFDFMTAVLIKTNKTSCLFTAKSLRKANTKRKYVYIIYNGFLNGVRVSKTVVVPLQLCHWPEDQGEGSHQEAVSAFRVTHIGQAGLQGTQAAPSHTAWKCKKV